MHEENLSHEQSKENFLNQKMNSYELMIAHHILNQIGIHLSSDKVKEALKDKNSKYHILLSVPMLNVFNSLLLAQIQSYKLFCQKKLADFIILTNPSEEEQQQIDFEDKIAQDFLEYKDKMCKSQENLRELEQQFYDDLAACQAFLKKIIRQQIMEFGEYIGTSEPFVMEEFGIMRSKVRDIKQQLLQAKLLWHELAEEINLKWVEKGGYILSPEDEMAQRTELMFWKNLGLE